MADVGFTGPIRKTVFAGFQTQAAQGVFPANGTVTVKYRTAGGDTSATDTYVLNQLHLDVTRGYGETITAGSVRFTLGGSIYTETAGKIYRDPSPETGAGTLAGTIDRASGRVYLSSWTSDGSNTVALESLVTELAGQPIEMVTFRTPVAPIRAGSLQIRYQLLDGTTKTKTVDETGVLEDNDCTITADYHLGVIQARFGRMRLDSSLSPAEKLEFWYDPLSIVEIDGVDYIWHPAFVLADSVIYNAVAQTVLPPDSEMIGVNAARLPADGKALIFNRGRLALVHHTATHSENALSPTQQVDMGRERLYRVIIEDANQLRFPANFYSVNRETGIVTMASDLNLTGYSAPYAFKHTVADLARIVDMDISGTLTFNKPLSHTFPATTSRVSSLLYIGTLQARVTNVFEQATWTGDWLDDPVGDPPLAQYDDVNYPILVTNAGAYQDRFLIRFTSSTAFQVIGEQLGIIAEGTIAEDCSPVNPLTGGTMFTIQSEGWGIHWSTGYCLRFNIIGAAWPIDCIRAIQPSQPTGDLDQVELLLVGNINA